MKGRPKSKVSIEYESTLRSFKIRDTFIKKLEENSDCADLNMSDYLDIVLEHWFTTISPQHQCPYLQ